MRYQRRNNDSLGGWAERANLPFVAVAMLCFLVHATANGTGPQSRQLPTSPGGKMVVVGGIGPGIGVPTLARPQIFWTSKSLLAP